MGPPIGIDLGTCYSCVGTFQNGQVEIIPNSYGNRVSPSCVAFRDSERLLGESAFNQAAFNPENTVYEVKRLIGRNLHDESVKEDLPLLPFTVVEEDSKIKIEVEFHGEKKRFLPEEISSFVLSHMKDIAEKHLETDITDAVITVPAYFNNDQRQATKTAGEIAGLNIMRIINEPTAAAIAYGLNKFSDMKKAKNILVFDLGGGTFDVSILTMEHDDDDTIDVLAVDGDTHLGGADFTNKLVTYLQHVFLTDHHVDISQNKRARRRLFNACEKAKIRLSSHLEANIELDDLVPSVDFYTTVTRQKFERLCENLFAKVMGPLDNAMKEAKLVKTDIDEIVLVGGSTRIPMIQQLVSTYFHNKELNKSINPDEAIAFGATIQAAILKGDPNIPELVLVDVIPMSLGWKAKDGSMQTMIRKNTKIPTQRTQMSASEILISGSYGIDVCEGERLLASENLKLGRVPVATTPGTLSKFKITFEVDTNGIMTAFIQDWASGNSNQVEIARGANIPSTTEVARLKSEAKAYKKDDLKEIERLSAKNRLSIASVNIKYRIDGWQALSDQTKERLRKKCNEADDWVKEHPNENVGTYEEKRLGLLSVWRDVSNSTDIGFEAADDGYHWQRDESGKKVREHETSGDRMFAREGLINAKEALKLYGKAYSAALEKELTGKMPNLLLKMGKCFLKISEGDETLDYKLLAARHSSINIGTAIHVGINNGQSEEWTLNAVEEAKRCEKLFFNSLLPQIENKNEALVHAAGFSFHLLQVFLPNHPFQDVSISVHKQVAFMAFDLASEFLRDGHHHGGRNCLQTMLIPLMKAKHSFTLKDTSDNAEARELQLLTEDYNTSSDIASALEALEAGHLITSLAEKEMSSKDVQRALNLGWNALDKFKEAENLSESTVDDIFYKAKCGRGFLYLNIFKNVGKAKHIFEDILESSAFESGSEKKWFQDAKTTLIAMEANEPAAIKAKTLQELKPVLDSIRKSVEEAGSDTQKLIDYIYRNHLPIPNNRGTLRPKPIVSKIGESKAIRKMIYMYHPDKIDKSDMKYKLLCEEITKIFTEKT